MKNVEDIYPISPMQELMLLHLLAQRDSAVLFEQMCYTLHGDLDVASFQSAWQHVVDRHPMLRTAFLSEGLERPLQVVRKTATLLCDVRDWQGLYEDEWRQRFDVYLEEDRRRGFDPTQAPLMRLALMRTNEEQHCFVMSMHHVLLDRWSMATVLNEAMAAYESLCRGRSPHLAPVVRYRDYVEWLMQRDLADDESYWRRKLAGFTVPTPLPVGGGTAPAGQSSSQRMTLDPARTTAIESFARSQRVTMNVLLGAVWGLVLAQASGERDVVFGATMSGRPADLPGVESIVGLFINNLPVRVKIAPDEPVGAWLESLQDQHGELQQHEHTPLAVVQQSSELTGGQLLFDSLLVFQNDPNRPAGTPGETPSLELRPLHAEMRTNYALTLTVVPAADLGVQLTYDQSRIDEATIATLLRNIETLLERIPADPNQPVEALLSGLDRVEQRVPASSETPPASTDRAVAPLPDDEVPTTESEVAVARIWEEVLGVEAIGLNDNFFDVGGTSVLALQTIARIESDLGVVIGAVELMTQTLRQVAGVCAGSRAKSRSGRRKRKWWSFSQGRPGT